MSGTAWGVGKHRVVNEKWPQGLSVFGRPQVRPRIREVAGSLFTPAGSGSSSNAIGRRFDFARTAFASGLCCGIQQ